MNAYTYIRVRRLQSCIWPRSIRNAGFRDSISREKITTKSSVISRPGVFRRAIFRYFQIVSSSSASQRLRIIPRINSDFPSHSEVELHPI